MIKGYLRLLPMTPSGNVLPSFCLFLFLLLLLAFISLLSFLHFGLVH